jgi:hypothetical protein
MYMELSCIFLTYLLKHYPEICLGEEMKKKITKKFSQESLCLYLDSNRASPEHKTKSLALEPTCSISNYQSYVYFANSCLLLCMNLYWRYHVYIYPNQELNCFPHLEVMFL